MVIKIISGILLLFSAIMGAVQGIRGWHITLGDKEPFVIIKEKLKFSDNALKAFAALTILSALLLLPPQTFYLRIF